MEKSAQSKKKNLLCKAQQLLAIATYVSGPYGHEDEGDVVYSHICGRSPRLRCLSLARRHWLPAAVNWDLRRVLPGNPRLQHVLLVRNPKNPTCHPLSLRVDSCGLSTSYAAGHFSVQDCLCTRVCHQQL
jgi:hypothetical protein